MALTLNKKKEILEKVKGAVEKSKSVVFVNFHELPVGEEQQMRSKLRENAVGYFVAKKTIVKKALADSKVEGNIPELQGELAIAFGDGETDSAREVFEFGKTVDNKVSILGGIFENRFLDKEEMTKIAQIPDMLTLRAQFVNVINSPIQGLAVALSAIAENKPAR